MNLFFYIFIAITNIGFLHAEQQGYSNGYLYQTPFEIKNSVEFPSIILSPGKYVIRFSEHNQVRKLVEILNDDQSKVLGTVMAIADYAARPDQDDIFVYHKIDGASIPSMKSWYYAGSMNGLEFIYSKKRAKEIAEASEDHVLGSDGKNSAIFAITPNGTEVLLYKAP